MTNTRAIAEPGSVRREAAGYLRFLCVDDNDLIRDSICSILIGKGWGCQTTNSGAAALHWLATAPEPVDFIITDHQMPEMDGLEFVGKLRAMNFTGRILVWSATVNSLEQAAYKTLNVDAIVRKSGNPELLLKAITELH